MKFHFSSSPRYDNQWPSTGHHTVITLVFLRLASAGLMGKITRRGGCGWLCGRAAAGLAVADGKLLLLEGVKGP